MSDDPYEIGYGKPPRHSQFRPGNQAARGRKRRKKKTFSIAEILHEAMSAKRKIKRGDRVVEMDAAKIMVERLIQMMLTGSLRDLRVIFGLLERYAPAVLAAAAEELAITYHRAEGSTVPLPPADLWKADKS